MKGTALLVGMGLGLGDVSGFAAPTGGFAAPTGGLAAGSSRPSSAARATAGSSVVTGGTKTPIKAVRDAQNLREGETRLTDIASVANLEEFQRTITRPKQVVAVWFQASWCRKCKYIGTRLKRLDEHLPAYLTNNLVVVSIDVNQVAEVPQRQKIKDLPTIQFFVGGEVVGSYVATDRGEVFYANMEKHLRKALGEDVA